MLNSGKKIILTLVLSEKEILKETKNHTPSCKLNGRSPIPFVLLYKNKCCRLIRLLANL